MIHRMDPPADPDREPMPERLAADARPDRADCRPTARSAGRYEVKWDGVRALAYVEPRPAAPESRNGNDITARYPELREPGRALGAREACSTARSSPSTTRAGRASSACSRRMHLAIEAAVRRAVREHAGRLRDLRRALPRRPPADRRCPTSSGARCWRSSALGGPHWQMPGHRTTDAAGAAAASAPSAGAGGRRGQAAGLPLRARAGGTGAWVKVKNVRRQELVSAAGCPARARRTDDRRAAGGLPTRTAALRLRRAGRHRLHRAHAARAGRRGWSRCAPTVAVRPAAPPAAAQSAGVRRARAGGRGRVRRVDAQAHAAGAVVQGPARRQGGDRGGRESDDVAAAASGRGRCGTVPDGRGVAERAGRDGDPAGARRRSRSTAARCSSRTCDKVLYPAAGFTKGQSSTTTRGSRPAVLPHLRDRPLTLKRYPDGVDGEYFYEKQSPVAPARLGADRGAVEPARKRTIDYTLAQDRAHARVAGQPGRHRAAHVAVAGAPTLDAADDARVRPRPGRAGRRSSSARRWRCGCAACSGSSAWRRGQDIGLQGHAGSTCRSTPDVTYDQTKPFAQAVAQLLEQQHPELVVSRMTKDCGARARCSSTGARTTSTRRRSTSYSLRARERPTVSTPVEWEEVEQAVEARDADALAFTSDDVLDRVQRRATCSRPCSSASRSCRRSAAERHCSGTASPGARGPTTRSSSPSGPASKTRLDVGAMRMASRAVTGTSSPSMVTVPEPSRIT